MTPERRLTIDSFPMIGLYTDLHTWRNTHSAGVCTYYRGIEVDAALQSALQSRVPRDLAAIDGWLALAR